jgi:2'-hydroxyisoflavone reductase
VRILVFGGTRFVGRAVVEQLLARGHELTLLNRGQSAPDLFPGVARLTLDRRDVTLETLGSGSWDVVVDMNAYFPREIAAAVAALHGRVRRYVMCSTGSVYTGLESYPIAEDAPLYACTPEQAEDPGLETYGRARPSASGGYAPWLPRPASSASSGGQSWSTARTTTLTAYTSAAGHPHVVQ